MAEGVRPGERRLEAVAARRICPQQRNGKGVGSASLQRPICPRIGPDSARALQSPKSPCAIFGSFRQKSQAGRTTTRLRRRRGLSALPVGAFPACPGLTEISRSDPSRPCTGPKFCIDGPAFRVFVRLRWRAVLAQIDLKKSARAAIFWRSDFPEPAISARPSSVLERRKRNRRRPEENSPSKGGAARGSAGSANQGFFCVARPICVFACRSGKGIMSVRRAETAFLPSNCLIWSQPLRGGGRVSILPAGRALNSGVGFAIAVSPCRDRRFPHRFIFSLWSPLGGWPAPDPGDRFFARPWHFSGSGRWHQGVGPRTGRKTAGKRRRMYVKASTREVCA